MKKKITLLGILVSFLLSACIPTVEVFAVKDVTFYAQNKIVFYDPDACGTKTAGGGSGSTQLVGNDNYEKALRFYVSKGLPLYQAAGILGNFKQESRMNPAIIQGGKIVDAHYKPVDGTGFGIAQWTFTSRQSKLVALSTSSRLSIVDLGLQLNFTWDELQGVYKDTLTALKSTTTADEAALVFHKGYEGSADTESMLKVRSDNALAIYNDYKTKIPDGSVNATTAQQICTGSGKGSAYVDGFTIYNQNDPQWANVWYGGPSNPNSSLHGTVGSAGCGPSSMAMVITALTKKVVTPKDTAEYGRAHGTVYNLPSGAAGGSLHNLEIIGKNWGLTGVYVEKDVAVINKGLRSGGLVVISGAGSAPFTSGGHFVTIRAVTDSGKWLLGDSNGTKGIANSQSTKEWDPADLVARMGGYHFLFTYGGKKL